MSLINTLSITSIHVFNWLVQAPFEIVVVGHVNVNLLGAIWSLRRRFHKFIQTLPTVLLHRKVPDLVGSLVAALRVLVVSLLRQFHAIALLLILATI
jgi:hypothetical protein